MTAFLRLFLLIVAVLTTIGCGLDDDGDVSCTPAPQISSSPPTGAVVGQQYVYYVDASYLCGFWSICNNIEGIQLPDGAVIDEFYDSISWTPGPDQASRDVPFAIATRYDDCGDRVTQSWTVHVSPAP